MNAARDMLEAVFTRHHKPLHERLAEITAELKAIHGIVGQSQDAFFNRLMQGIKKTMVDELATALQPLDAGIAQVDQDVINLGTVDTAAFAALQTKIAALQNQITNNETINPADLADISTQVSNLQNTHNILLQAIQNSGSAAASVDTVPVTQEPPAPAPTP